MNDLALRLASVTAYRELLDTPLLTALNRLLTALSERASGLYALQYYSQVCYELNRTGSAGLGEWLLEQLRYTSTPYPEAVATGSVSPVLEAGARRDIELFRELALLPCPELKGQIAALLDQSQYAATRLPEWECSAPFTFDDLTGFYRANGAGFFAKYRAFVWEGGRLNPVPSPDFVPQKQLWGYRFQREKIISNTRILMNGRQANNVLLYGESGTGKSALVKALLGIEEFSLLRLIEIHKDNLSALPDLIRTLGHRPQKFILFIDDLAFDKDDKTYSSLKTILEGGLEPRPANVAVYATSNRRHLVRETFSDRAGDEVDTTETIQEKTSLSDRFGVKLPFLALNRMDFLQMVEDMARMQGLDYDRDDLRREAVKWELRSPNRSPRTALQFLASLQGEL